MKVKLRMIGGKVDSTSTLMNMENMQLGEKILVDNYPVTKDIGIITILEDFNIDENEFQIHVKNLKEELLGKGNVFKLKIMTEENIGAVLYNVNKATFENRESGYIVELHNKEKVIDKIKIMSDTNIYNIYENLDDRGSIEF